MLENYKIRLRYMSGQERQKASGSNEDLSIDHSYMGDTLTVNLKTNSPIQITKVWLEYDYIYNTHDKFFANGFQSWTDSREFGVNDMMKDYGFVVKTIFGKAMKNVGDYNFVDYAHKKGVFHSHGYAYIRTTDSIKLIGSLSDRKGYTIIKADMNENKLYIYKDLEGVVIDGQYQLFNLVELSGEYNVVFDNYFAKMNIPTPQAQPIKGYTTWYNYYENIKEDIVLRDLNAICKATDKINTFQIDDGYQMAVGEWLNINATKFPNGMKAMADAIHAKGLSAGIWLAPFGVKKTSSMVSEHPSWFVKDKNGKPMVAGLNWGGFYALDIYNVEVRAYIKNVFKVYSQEWGYDLFKLDFLYAAAMVPAYNKSRGEIMYDAIDFIKECLGDKKVLGCGVPLMPCFGKVEYMRIGADMGLAWKKSFISRFTHREDVSTEGAIYNSLYRRHLNKRAFLCDPDVFLMRDYNIHFSLEQRKLIATIIKLFGSVLFTSDDTSKYSAEQMEVMKDTLDNEGYMVKDVTQNGDEITIDYSYKGSVKQLKFNILTGTM